MLSQESNKERSNKVIHALNVSGSRVTDLPDPENFDHHVLHEFMVENFIIGLSSEDIIDDDFHDFLLVFGHIVFFGVDIIRVDKSFIVLSLAGDG